jgi:hypothetical protein
MSELKKALSKIKNRSSPGRDGICNLMLKNLSPNFMAYLLKLCNLSLGKGLIPKAWKEAMICMIPKGQKLASNPANYRPISLISCLSKLIEKIVARRLSFFLESNHLLIKQQSGFRSGRRTSDNLVFLSQKIAEAFNQTQKVVSLFFDIEAAFDSVWHDGLIFKLIKLGVPSYIIRWLDTFLEGRSFVIKVGDTVTASAPIAAGVPQGSSISPIIFSAFINDIPTRYDENDCFSLLFADDLNTFFIYERITTEIRNKINIYMIEIEKWLSLWRMNMAPSKCQFTIFARYNREKAEFDINLFGERVPYEANPTSLGVTFDPTLSFRAQVKKIKDKCNSRMNILKIISHKSWALSTKTLVSIYKSLIGSVIDYSFFMCSQLSEKLMKSVQATQNNAMRIIFKKGYDPVTRKNTTTDTLCELSSLPLVEDRMMVLNQRYFDSAVISVNQLILDLGLGFRTLFLSGDIKNKTLLCDFMPMLEVILV